MEQYMSSEDASNEADFYAMADEVDRVSHAMVKSFQDRFQTLDRDALYVIMTSSANLILCVLFSLKDEMLRERVLTDYMDYIYTIYREESEDKFKRN